jgi:hypothetical protein
MEVIKTLPPLEEVKNHLKSVSKPTPVEESIPGARGTELSEKKSRESNDIFTAAIHISEQFGQRVILDRDNLGEGVIVGQHIPEGKTLKEGEIYLAEEDAIL